MAGPSSSAPNARAATCNQATEPVRRVPVFAIVALALLMMSVDSTIVATALGALQHGLGTTINWAGWTITAYSLGFVLMLPISGKLAERYGSRRVFLGSVIAFSGASLCCGFADNVFVLIALRAVQAAGGAGLTPSATGIIVDHFGGARDRAVSLFGSIFPIGAMIGPVFGGLFITYWSWRGIFFVNVPIGVAILVLALRYIPRDRPRAKAAPGGFDPAGMALLGAALLAGMLAASYLGESGATLWSAAFVVPAVILVLALWRFFEHIDRSTSPFIAPRLIHGPGFGVVNLINMSYGGMTNGVVMLLPLYATHRYGIEVLAAGSLLVAQGLAAILFSLAAALALRRTGYRLPVYAGGTAIAVGLLLLAVEPAFGVTPYVWLTGSAFLVGAGRGAINPASRNAGLQLAPEHSSIIAALRTAALQVGSITTVSIVTAILARSADPGSVQGWVYVATALLLLGALRVIARIPEHHGSW
ncbi:MAG TPA: MFS transporter [Burkholderiaceae bacterium]|nr:MFS transporter [Burkholderiaceae bacterium]